MTTEFYGADTPQRVQFGTRDDDSMPLSWAEKVLTWLKDERPQVFADAMTSAVFGIEKKRGRVGRDG
jgi:hypothetical protein